MIRVLKHILPGLLFALSALPLLAAAPAPLLPNGDFEQADPAGSGPAFWQPLKPGFAWVDIGGEHHHVMRFTIPRDIARSTGFQFDSQRFPVQQGQTYDCSVEIKTDKPDAVVFLNGFARLNGESDERMVYRKQIKSDKRIQPGGQWGTLQFQLTPEPPTAHSNEVLDLRQRKLGVIDQMDFEIFIYGADGGVLELDNVKMAPAAKKTDPQALSQQQAEAAKKTAQSQPNPATLPTVTAPTAIYSNEADREFHR